MKKIFLDFETRSAADLKKVGLHVYAAHPTTDILCIAWSELDSEEVQLWSPRGSTTKIPSPLGDLLSAVALGDSRIIAHNAPFEYEIWNQVCRKRYPNFPELKIEQMDCTMAMAYSMALPGSLEAAAAATGIKQQKDMAGNRVMMQLSKPRSVTDDGRMIVWWEDKEKLKKVYEYCIQDVKVEKELYKRLSPLSESERKLWLLDHKINARGVKLSVKAAQRATEIVDLERARLNQKIHFLTKGAVSVYNAVGQLADWIRAQGVTCKGVNKADVNNMLDRVDLPEIVKEVLEVRQEAAKSSVAKADAMLGGVGEDGRMRGLFQFCGASTGRWAGRRIQPQNFPRPQLSQKQLDELFKILES